MTIETSRSPRDPQPRGPAPPLWRALTPEQVLEPESGKHIWVCVADWCVQKLDRSLSPKDQATLAVLIAAYPDVTELIGKSGTATHRHIPFRGHSFYFGKIESGDAVIYDIAEGDDNTDPPQKRRLPDWMKYSLGGAISALVREIVRRLSDIIQRSEDRHSARAETSSHLVRLRVGRFRLCRAAGSLATVPIQRAHPFLAATPLLLAGCGTGSSPMAQRQLEIRSDHDRTVGRYRIVGADLSPPVPTSVVSNHLKGTSINMTDWDRQDLLQRAIADLRAYLNGDRVLHGARVRVTPTADVYAIRRRLNDSPTAFAARLGISLDLLIAWECGDDVPSEDVCRLLCLLDMFPEEVSNELALLRSRLQ